MICKALTFSSGLTSHHSLHSTPKQPHHPPLSSLNTLPPTWSEYFAQVLPSVCDTHLLSWPRYLLLFLQVAAQSNFLKLSLLVQKNYNQSVALATTVISHSCNLINFCLHQKLHEGLTIDCFCPLLYLQSLTPCLARTDA